jgi:hypothetical protein
VAELYVDPFEELLAGLSAQELIDGLTVHELALKTGRNVKWLRDQLHLIAAAGRLIIGKKKALDIRTGRRVMVTCYKVAVPAKAPARGRK